MPRAPIWYSTGFRPTDDGGQEWVYAAYANGRHPDAALVPSSTPVELLATDPTAVGVVRFRQTPSSVVVLFVDIRGHAAAGAVAAAPSLFYVLNRDVAA